MMKKALAIGTILIMVAVVFTMMANVSADIEEPEWASWYDGPARRSDYSYDCAADANGNVFTVGYCDVGSYRYDIVTIKNDANGNQLWARTWGSPYGYSDYGYACTTDPAGNVYVLGRADYYVFGGRYNWVTLKYNPSGSLMWVRTYNGPGNSNDYVNYYGQPIQYDNGRIYCTGYSYGVGTSYDATTICYDANSGGQYWVQRYHGGYSSDYGYSLVISGQYVYMAGYTYQAFPRYADILTICYNKITGSQIWLRTYHGGYSSQYATDITTDNAGRVFVGGRGYVGSSSTNGYDYITIAYSATTGTQLWLKNYHGGYSSDYGYGINYDAGQVFMSGYTYQNPYNTRRADIGVVAYDAVTGNQNWVAVYNGPRAGYSYEYSYCKPAIAAGAIAVTGYGYGITDTYYDALVLVFDSSGGLAMEGRFNPNLASEYEYGRGIASDADGNIFACGYGYPDKVTSYYNILTLKFESAIPAVVDMEPTSLNLDSMGNYVNVKIESFPENPEFTALDVDGDSVTVNGVGADLKFGTWNKNRYIGKVDRLMVEDAIGGPGDEIEVEIKGKLTTGKGFVGIATIKAIQN